MELTINKWGHSLGVRIPSKLAKKKNLTDGSKVEAIETEDGIHLRVLQNDLSLDDIVNSIPEDYESEGHFDNMISTEQW